MERTDGKKKESEIVNPDAYWPKIINAYECLMSEEFYFF